MTAGRAVVQVGVVGDRNDDVIAHRANPLALSLAAAELGIAVHATWLPTERIADETDLDVFDAIWCVPASPYRSTDGALYAIRHARESGIPFLGTCGGFQHALLEYAHAIGHAEATHAELDALTGRAGAMQVITPLACALVEQTGRVHFHVGSHLRAAYGVASAVEGYHCRYGLDPALRDALVSGPLRVSAEDDAGDVRGVELTGHPFFVATLFQPERAALDGRTPPVVRAFVSAASARHGTRSTHLRPQVPHGHP